MIKVSDQRSSTDLNHLYPFHEIIILKNDDRILIKVKYSLSDCATVWWMFHAMIYKLKFLSIESNEITIIVYFYELFHIKEP